MSCFERSGMSNACVFGLILEKGGFPPSLPD
jgi:hypothetical protein